MPKNFDYILNLLRNFRRFGNLVLLESQKEDHPASTKSYLAAKPKAWIKSKGNKITIFQDGVEVYKQGNPFEVLQEFRAKQESWLFGYFGYDLKNKIEELDSKNPSLNTAPDMFFLVPEILIEFSREGSPEYLLGEEEQVKLADEKKSEFKCSKRTQINKEEYLKKVKVAQGHIEEGDYYEINLSHPLEFNFEGDPIDLYKAMREIGPVPFASYVFVDGISVCCSSPERFIAKKEDKVWSQPIKGTSLKGLGKDEDGMNLLLQSEKNRAENLMIVDLVRNDLGKIAKKGSVKVKDLFEIQSFKTVHQMVSTVECEVEPEVDSIEIIKSCFPMGSMTGAPKISAMQSIEELEDYKRGIYSGAIGYISPKDDFDFNVVIRTAIIEKNTLIYPVGGAITSDSDPEEEWEETLIKARALTNSID
tara:strand:+ start:8933 stop:10192 length:1260 start_codon:yes stop_codon:yes gene_type:complete